MTTERRGAFDFPRSISQRRAYRGCNYKWLLRYRDGWERTIKKGTYAFGDAWQVAVESVLKGEASSPEGMYTRFMVEWDKVAREDAAGKIEWNSRNGLRFFAERAKGLAEVAFREIMRVCGVPKEAATYNQMFVYDLAPGTPERVVPDYIGPALHRLEDGSWTERCHTLIDWKTGDREYKVTEVELDDQLTDYQLGTERHYGQPVEQVGLCVFVYQAMPKVQWILYPPRPLETVAQFVAGAVVDNQRIMRGEFPRNTSACFARGECEFVPLCYPSQRERIAAELTKPEQPRNEQPLDWIHLESIED
jgi:PD-(D/E)XK nuclease superfamily